MLVIVVKLGLLDHFFGEEEMRLRVVAGDVLAHLDDTSPHVELTVPIVEQLCILHS